MKKSGLAAVILFVTAQIALSQNWVLTNSGTNDWLCVASSANGKTLIAGQWAGNVAVSTNVGETWTTVMTNQFWNSLAASADGTKLLAASANVDSAHISGVFLSTNSGVSWISNNLPDFYWGSVAMSADGSTMAAVAPISSGASSWTGIGAVFCTTNAGINWISNNLINGSSVSSTLGAYSVAMSADGSKIFVVAPPIVSYSTNFGTSWMQMTSAPPIESMLSPSQVIASSADGNKLILSIPYRAYEVTGVYTSTNSGNEWSLTSLPDTNWSFVASSADGKTLLAAAGGFSPGPLYISTNSGATWMCNTNENWAGVACSADGGALFAVGGFIYRSQSIQPPFLNVTPVSSELQLSWLIPSADFELQQSADLYNWSIVTNSPKLNPANLNEQIRVSPANPTGFYRLRTVPGN